MTFKVWAYTYVRYIGELLLYSHYHLRLAISLGLALLGEVLTILGPA